MLLGKIHFALPNTVIVISIIVPNMFIIADQAHFLKNL